MGLFPRLPRKAKSDPLAEAVANAYRLGHAEGRIDGAATAMESMAATLDAVLASGEFPTDITRLMQTISRHSKQSAAELTDGAKV